MPFVLNVRESQILENHRVLEISEFHEVRLLALIGRPALLYRPRDNRPAHYYGVCQVADVLPSRLRPHMVDVLLDYVQMLDRPLTLTELATQLGTSNGQFYEYAKIVRHVSEVIYSTVINQISDRALHGLAEHEQSQFFENRKPTTLRDLRRRRIRNLVFRLLGDTCLFCRARTTDLPGRLVETTIAHIIPLQNGGPDSLRNVIPLCRRCHFLFDHGVLGLSDYGQVLRATPQSNSLGLVERISFDELTLWPKLECIRWHRQNIYQRGPTKAQYIRQQQEPFVAG